MSLTILKLVLLALTCAIQFITLRRFQDFLWGHHQKTFKRLFFSFVTIALFIQFAYLLVNEMIHHPANLNNVILLFSNTLLLLMMVTIIKTYLMRTRSQVIELKSELRFDALTQTLSRRAILSHCELELARSQRNLQPISILAIDLDHLKQLNDLYGHLIGDEVLIKSTQKCKQLLREIDLIGRIGGDEFIVLLPNTNFDAAQEIASRIEQEMSNLNMNLSTPIPLPISLSIGIATYNSCSVPIQTPAEDTQTILKKLMETSDLSLYKNKRFNHARSTWHASNDQILKTG